MRSLLRHSAFLSSIVAVFLGAFLAFQVQPVISKAVLPWFGGSPAVWTTCMLFFQVLLFGGYLYAHLLTSYIPPRYQGILYTLVLMGAIISLPIAPDSTWKPTGQWPPILSLLGILTVHIGLPYFVLTSTGPLVQAWLARRDLNNRQPDRSVYRLYAFSNIGSMAALISYPILVEPLFPVREQATSWSLLFCGFAIVQGLLAMTLGQKAGIFDKENTPSNTLSTKPLVRPSRRRRIAWLLLPALASVTLLAVTNHVCQEIAAVPFLWVLPLSLYLLSFVICFNHSTWYAPRRYAQIAVGITIAIALTSATSLRTWIVPNTIMHVSLLMVICMLCHGETMRLKPHPRFLTEYYLMLSAGGALGGLTVALVCPLVFSGYTELPLCLGISVALAAALLVGYRNDSKKSQPFDLRRVRKLRPRLVVLALMITWMVTETEPPGLQASSRNFFGVLHIIRANDCVGLVHGQTLHGAQRSGAQSQQPTTYYGHNSGIGKVLNTMSRRGPIRLATIGLGCGTLATYGRSEDEYHFIDINPEVVSIAKEYFTFLKESSADIRITVGDGRTVLERSQPEAYDIVALDAFSSDSIPAHLLTREALSLYRSRLRPDGIIAIHISNRHLDLQLVVHNLALHAGLKSVSIESISIPAERIRQARWIAIADADNPIWDSPEFAQLTPPDPTTLRNAPLWTDQYHDLLRIIRLRPPQ